MCVCRMLLIVFAWSVMVPEATRAATPLPARPQETETPAAGAEPAKSPAEPVVKGFQLSGERWTGQLYGHSLSGILLKPEGNGPFPAVLISHGLGGSAESFGLGKAREMVQWGFVCIAPNYTHNVRGGPRSTEGAAGAGSQDAGKGQKEPPPTSPGRGGQPADYGASQENLRRARACVEILRSLPYVDAQRVFAYGHSMGGFVTIGLAAVAPDVLKAAAVSGSGIAPRAGFPAPSLELAEKVRTPFLLIHGSVDRVVRPQQSAAFKEILDKNKVPNDRRVFEGEDHPIDQTRRGVYCVFAGSGRLLYVGKASMGSVIGARLAAWFHSDRETGECRVVHPGWSEKPMYVATLPVPDDMPFEAAALEEYLIGQLQPPDNVRGRHAAESA